MGLLDDAIREHLDLKRRRGADPGEIERAEREALGPVRRGPEPAGDEPAGDEPVLPKADPRVDTGYPEPDLAISEPEPAYQSADEEPWEPFQEDPELRAVDEDEELPPYEAPRAPDGDPLLDDEQFYGGARGSGPLHPAESDPGTEAESVPAPHPADPPPSAHGEPQTHVDQETEEYELEPEEADDDVLETTPEFLQDAPEHDRLWFEQRPPRDFDFDG